METALIPSGEVRDPARDVPRATLAAVALVVLLYVSIQLVCQGVLGPALDGATAPVARAAGALWAPGFGLLIATASVSMAGFLLGNLLGSSRLLYALGRDGLLPRALGQVTERHRVPLVAIVVHGGIACALAIGGTFERLALVSGGANCVVYVLVAAAAWQLQRRDVRGAGDALPRAGRRARALAVDRVDGRDPGHPDPRRMERDRRRAGRAGGDLSRAGLAPSLPGLSRRRAY